MCEKYFQKDKLCRIYNYVFQNFTLKHITTKTESSCIVDDFFWYKQADI
jgi:hypothetical protein